MDIKYICTKNEFKGSMDDDVLLFDAYKNYEQLNEYFGTFDKNLMCSKEEYFDGFDYDTWDDYVIIENGKIISRVGIWKYSDTEWEVAGVATLPEYCCRGYGERIVTHCIAIILACGRIATCTTKDTNVAMQRTAEKAGFKVDTRESNE